MNTLRDLFAEDDVETARAINPYGDGRSRRRRPEVEEMWIDEQAALVAPELPARVAEALYEALDPHFREFAWKDALEGQQEWARGRARRVAPIVVEQGFLLAQEWTRGIMERSEDVYT